MTKNEKAEKRRGNSLQSQKADNISEAFGFAFFFFFFTHSQHLETIFYAVVKTFCNI